MSTTSRRPPADCSGRTEHVHVDTAGDGIGADHPQPDAFAQPATFAIHPERRSTFDHGQGWGALEASLLGKPHLTP